MINRRRLQCVVLMFLALVLVSGCVNGKVMSQKQQATIWMDTYNAQYDDCLAVLINPASTETQLAIAKQKKVVLTQVWPMLKIYADIVDKGGTPTEQLIGDISKLMNQLTGLAQGGH